MSTRSLRSPVSTARTAAFLSSTIRRTSLPSPNSFSQISLPAGQPNLPISALHRKADHEGMWNFQTAWNVLPPGRQRWRPAIGEALVLYKIESTLQFQLELCSLWQIHLMTPAGFDKIGFQGGNCGVLSGFFRIFILDASYNALACAFGSGSARCLLGAGLAFEHSLFFWRHFDTVVARDAHDVGDDWQPAKLCADFIEDQPYLCAARDAGG